MTTLRELLEEAILLLKERPEVADYDVVANPESPANIQLRKPKEKE